MYDLAIIGGGPAGYTAAERAAHYGLSVVVFEENAFGGVCLNEGCIPTKTLLYSAKLYHNAKLGSKYGIAAENVGFDYEKIVSRKNKVVRKLNAGIRARLTAAEVKMVAARAEIKHYTADKISILVGDEEFEACNLLLCNGSKVAIPPIAGVDTARYITSKEALELKSVPESIVVIGGGVIGMEFAGLFGTFGAKVSVVEMAGEILPPVDSEISAMLRAEYTKQGIDFFVGSKVSRLDDNKVIFSDSEGNERTLAAEQVLLCVGRRPRIDGLEKLELRPYRNGIEVNERMQTSLPNVYAAGDITALSMLAHTATRQAEVAVNNISGRADTINYDAIPSVVYTNPEIAGVGYTEDRLKAEGKAYRVKRLPMTFSGRFVAENEGGNGLCKLIFDDNDVIIGCHLIGNPASEIIATAALAIEERLTAERFGRLIVPHPSVAEIVRETLLS